MHSFPFQWFRECLGPVVLSLSLAVSCIQGWAEDRPASPWLTVDRIFDSSDFREKGAATGEWLEGGTGYTTLEDGAEGRSGKDIVWHDPATGRTEVLVASTLLIPSGKSQPLSIENYTFSTNRARLLVFTESRKVWRRNTRGDYWVLDISSRELKKLGGDAAPSSLMFATFSPDGTSVAYVREHNIYVQDLVDYRIKPLTQDGSADVINGTFDWVYEEELELRNGMKWSPDSRKLAFWQLNSAEVPEFYILNNTEGMYPRLNRFKYPKTGQKNSSVRVGVANVADGNIQWMGIPEDPTGHYLARMMWTPDARELLVQQLNRRQNTLKVWQADAATGEAHEILAERDGAWVDVVDEWRWSKEGERFLWVSERDGWRHLYSVSRDGKDQKLLTKGDFDVVSVAGVDEAHQWIYFMASPGDPIHRYLYRVKWNGHGCERVTPQNVPGTHGYDLSPDGQWAFHRFSTFEQPTKSDLIALPAHTVQRALEDNSEMRERLAGLEKGRWEFRRVRIDSGDSLDAYVMYPPGFDASRKYPVVFHVYGEPAGQTVTDAWHGNNQLWHWMLTQQGYVVMSVDNRGTAAPRGRDWRKVVYRKLGTLGCGDQASAVRTLLKENNWIDGSRIAVWGWSGGGSSTLNAIFRYPELYHTAMAVAFISNQRYYDTLYQERYMGLPDDNTEGYIKGSPITWASQLKGNLLMVHGTGDDNCHYQNAEALINELIAHNKQFTMMAYPNRTHSINEGANTSRHLYTLLTRYLNDKMPSDGLPKYEKAIQSTGEPAKKP